jgi:hypothetical protein
MRILKLTAATAAFFAAPLCAASATLNDHADKAAQADTIAWDFVEGITTATDNTPTTAAPRTSWSRRVTASRSPGDDSI